MTSTYLDGASPLPKIQMYSYQTEKLKDILEEFMPLMFDHWEEVALNRDIIPLDPDWERYEKLEEIGWTHMTTVRCDGVLVGYSFYLVSTQLHYRTFKIAQGDAFYLDPSHRRGGVGIKLFKEAEKALKELGVKKIINGIKLHRDVGKVFERLGYTPFERHYSKLI